MKEGLHSDLKIFEEFSAFTEQVNQNATTENCFDIAAEALFNDYVRFLSLSTLERINPLLNDAIRASRPKPEIPTQEFYNFCQNLLRGKSQLPQIRQTLEKYRDCNLDTFDHQQGFTPLVWAASSGDVEVVTALLDAGADASVHSDNGLTPLGWAVSKGHEDIVKLLIARKACPLDDEAGAHTPLQTAATKGLASIALVLLKSGADAHYSAKSDNYSVMTHACMQGSMTLVSALVEKYSVGVEERDASGRSPLCAAARGGHIDIMNYLWNRGARDLELASNEGWTALTTAATNSRNASMKWLLDKRANVNSQCQFGTSLHIGQHTQVDMLMKAGIDIEAYNPEGHTALHRLAERTGGGSEEEMLKELLKHGADVNKRTLTGGLTALHLACKTGVTSRVRLLLEHGADSKAATDDGFLPLGYAASSLVEELLVGPDFIDLLAAASTRGEGQDNNTAPITEELTAAITAVEVSKINQGDKRGNTALMYAALHNEVSNVKALLDAKAEASITNTTGHSPMLWALWHNNDELKTLLNRSPTQQDEDAIRYRDEWIHGDKRDLEDQYGNQQMLELSAAQWSHIRATTRQQARRTRGRDRSTASGEGSAGLGERMNDIPHTKASQEFLPAGWKPEHKSFIDWLNEIGTLDLWTSRKVNPDMESIIWDGRKTAWWKVAEGMEFAPIHSFAIFTYTYESDICYATNKAMRTGNMDGIAQWRPVIYWVSKALNALPPVPNCRRALRGIRMPNVDWEHYRPGTILTWGAFSSTSLAYKVASFFLRGQKGIIFDVRGVENGRLVSPFSSFPMEEEVVIPPNTRVRVDSIHSAEWRMLATGKNPQVDLIAAKRNEKDSFVVKVTVVDEDGNPNLDLVQNDSKESKENKEK